jgi:hypothetical protein
MKATDQNTSLYIRYITNKEANETKERRSIIFIAIFALSFIIAIGIISIINNYYGNKQTAEMIDDEIKHQNEIA